MKILCNTMSEKIDKHFIHISEFMNLIIMWTAMHLWTMMLLTLGTMCKTKTRKPCS